MTHPPNINFFKDFDSFSKKTKYGDTFSFIDFIDLEYADQIICIRDGLLRILWQELQGPENLKRFYLPAKYYHLLGGIPCRGFWAFKQDLVQSIESKNLFIYGILNPTTYLTIKKRLSVLKKIDISQIEKTYCLLDIRGFEQLNDLALIEDFLNDLKSCFHDIFFIKNSELNNIDFVKTRLFDLSPFTPFGLTSIEAHAKFHGASDLGTLELQFTEHEVLHDHNIIIWNQQSSFPKIDLRNIELIKLAKLMTSAITREELEVLKACLNTPVWFYKYLDLLASEKLK